MKVSDTIGCAAVVDARNSSFIALCSPLDMGLPPRRSFLHLSWALAGLLCAAGCDSPTPRGSSTTPTLALATGLAAESDLLARITTEVGDAHCSADAQCRTLPIGEKACGGPVSWLPWSAAMSQAAPLEAWANELAARQRQRHARSGVMSNCQYLPDPGAVCQAQRCVLRHPGAVD
ncbi:MAG: hypothetical protein KJ614_07400 [Gammaproteobacteria bacterium]|uniref:hypothetical protein n=1 Tax=Rhodoferax sp. TaxID=50421 RepID=UPI0017FE5A29|nr:hypothetical protein [Rhodoferax sp.]MBU3898742.1 hypothetical protein [Gammaproteobacteria bacterium]MBA3057101.1 hypothetical protein [Rhodoferax sp.]MBU3996568.1 hypothetical protein [Gammaproteobacteria bacterium]MBU4017791.1 hypothetical protein [Gammaproteobacteria bacterium]MBU4080725.1 hypothetical protein [Gammaproteobacteria bacterium]